MRRFFFGFAWAGRAGSFPAMNTASSLPFSVSRNAAPDAPAAVSFSDPASAARAVFEACQPIQFGPAASAARVLV